MIEAWSNVIRRLGSHTNRRIYFGYDRYVLPDLEGYLAVMKERHHTTEVICAVDVNYLHYLTSAELVCTALQADPDAIGILCCGTGLGMSIAANKFRGIYAARCTTVDDAESCRMINNSNVLCLGAKYGFDLNKKIIGSFLSAPYTGRKLEELEYITSFETVDPAAPAKKPITVRRSA